MINPILNYLAEEIGKMGIIAHVPIFTILPEGWTGEQQVIGRV